MFVGSIDKNLGILFMTGPFGACYRTLGPCVFFQTIKAHRPSQTSINKDWFVFVGLYDKNLGIIVCDRALAGWLYDLRSLCVFLKTYR